MRSLLFLFPILREARSVKNYGPDPNDTNLSKSGSGILPLKNGWKPLPPPFPSLKLVPLGPDLFFITLAVIWPEIVWFRGLPKYFYPASVFSFLPSCQGQRPLSSTSRVKLRKVLIRTITPSIRTDCQVRSTATV